VAQALSSEQQRLRGWMWVEQVVVGGMWVEQVVVGGVLGDGYR
jgi:hypothetical protein